MKQVVDFLPPDAVAYLRFPEAEVRFPIRPVPAGDFLVGSGADCDLRLGDGILPPLHSVLRASATEASWTRLVRSPELIVNGASVRQANLHDGDLIEIGPFRLIFRFAAEHAETSLQELMTRETTDVAAGSPEAMPVQQLVDAMENELDQLDRWERSVQKGLRELLNAVNQTSGRLRRTRTGTAEAAEQEQQDRVVDQQELDHLLRSQTERIDLLNDVLEQVIRQQRMMADVLRNLTQRVSRISAHTPHRRRAS